MTLSSAFRAACGVVLTSSIAVLSASLAGAQAPSTPYQLEPDADYLAGCFGGCTCPVVHAQGLGGSLELTYAGSTPDGYDHYAVTSVDWLLVFAGKTMHVTGDGRYDIGGQFALQHRLQLSLSFDGGPAESFDSGLIPGGAGFPRLEVLVSMNGLACYDEVFDVRAAPLTLGTAFCSSQPNSTGQATVLSATGTAVVAADDFALVATHAPPGNPGLFFFGQGQQQTPFGEGFLCVGTSIQRIQPAAPIDASGTAWRVLDLTQPPAAGRLVPGTTWSFQFWYRDPPGGPAGFNLSQGLSIDFL